MTELGLLPSPLRLARPVPGQKVTRAVRVLVSVLVVAFPLRDPIGASEVVSIGTTLVADNVSGTVEGSTSRLAEGDAIFRDELLEATTEGKGEFRFDDDTKIALGPGAKLTLDEFVYNSEQGKPSMVVNLVKGAFRFLTGKLDHNAYKIKTSNANLAVRGTVFDVFVSEDGSTVVLLHDGAVDICSASGTCRRHDTIGKFVTVSLEGVVSEPLKWTGKLLPGVSLKSAFPFLTRKLAIDPVRRIANVAVVGTGAAVVRSAGRRTVGAARHIGRTVRRVLRSPF